MYVPTAVVYHIGAATGKPNSPFKIYLCQRNSYFYRIKNLQTNLLLKFLIRRPRAIFEEIVTKKIKNYEFNLIVPYLKGDFDGLRGFGKMYRKRTRNFFPYNSKTLD